MKLNVLCFSLFFGIPCSIHCLMERERSYGYHICSDLKNVYVFEGSFKGLIDASTESFLFVYEDDLDGHLSNSPLKLKPLQSNALWI